MFRLPVERVLQIVEETSALDGHSAGATRTPVQSGVH
jgi:hypothetical protein